MNKNSIIKILIISIITILTFTAKSYCAENGTVRMKIDNSGTWRNINVSDSYRECESLNSTTSTLGTSALQAHLTTDYDWNAMAIFSISQYGGSTGNKPGMTNNNNSGIYDMNVQSWSTSILYSANRTNVNYQYLFDENETPKPFVNLINYNNGVEYNSTGSATGRIAISYTTDGGTRQFCGADAFTGLETHMPCRNS